MTIANRLTHTVTIYTQSDSTADRYGNPTDTFTTGTEVRAWVTPATGNEYLADRDSRVSPYLITLPAGTDVTAIDEVEWEGHRMRIVGRPNVFHTRSGEHHVELQAELLEG